MNSIKAPGFVLADAGYALLKLNDVKGDFFTWQA